MHLTNKPLHITRCTLKLCFLRLHVGFPNRIADDEENITWIFHLKLMLNSGFSVRLPSSMGLCESGSKMISEVE